ncbi:MAG: hypothetical protein JRF63_04710 [Deltaproteobacteria bacterium]|nr:hypothetical protein [Deltaproteobacteria bacterium]
MKWANLESISDLPRIASRIAREIDPRTVRFRDRPRRSRLWIAVPLLGATLVAGAAALAASGGDEPANEEVAAPSMNPPAKYTSPPALDPAERAAAAKPSTEAREQSSRHPNFHDPFYVFIEGEVTDISAYPLAEPPGMVVNLDGAPEPTSTPESMVGKDPRVRAIRRRITNKGVRYVLGLTIPIKRIDVLHEGSVVIITPVK